MSGSTVWLVIYSNSTPWKAGVFDIVGIYRSKAAAERGRSEYIARHTPTRDYEECTYLLARPLEGDEGAS